MKAIRSQPRVLFTVIAATAALASCVAPKAPPPPPAPTPHPAPPRPLPKPPADWRDAAQTPGTWTWALVGGQSTARFGAVGTAPLAALTCDRANGQVLLSRSAQGGTRAVPVQITTTSRSQPLLSEPLRSSAGTIAVVLRSRDPLLDAIAFSRGRFAFETAGEPTLYLPSWPELSRVIEDCR